MSTLVEKLEKLEKEFVNKARNNVSDIVKLTATTTAIGVHKAIEIVKQHSYWISVDERLPPDNMMVLAYCHIRKATGYAFVSHQQAWSFYYFTKNSENQALAMVNDISKWMPIPQPPIEVQP
jgi:hypothetical protein